MIPDSEPGTSLRDLGDSPLLPGKFNAVMDGYFLLIGFRASEEYYTIHSIVRGCPRPSGEECYAEFLYQINMLSQSTQ